MTDEPNAPNAPNGPTQSTPDADADVSPGGVPVTPLMVLGQSLVALRMQLTSAVAMVDALLLHVDLHRQHNTSAAEITNDALQKLHDALSPTGGRVKPATFGNKTPASTTSPGGPQ